ncbi:MAG: hypothetical protein ABJD07_07345, partial [Gemmatimonadaceae bacterium]
GAAAGLAVPFSGLKNDLGANAGYHLQGQVTWNTPSIQWPLRGEIGYTHFGFSQTIPGGKIEGSFRELSFIANAVVPLTVTGSTVRPYAIFGIGAYNGQESSNQQGSTIIKPSHTNLGLNGGAGIDFSLGGTAAFIEARLHAILNGANSTAVIGNNSTGTAIYIPITFGFHY